MIVPPMPADVVEWLRALLATDDGSCGQRRVIVDTLRRVVEVPV